MHNWSRQACLCRRAPLGSHRGRARCARRSGAAVGISTGLFSHLRIQADVRAPSFTSGPGHVDGTRYHGLSGSVPSTRASHQLPHRPSRATSPPGFVLQDQRMILSGLKQPKVATQRPLRAAGMQPRVRDNRTTRSSLPRGTDRTLPGAVRPWLKFKFVLSCHVIPPPMSA